MLTERNKTTIPSQQDKAQSLAYLSNLDENSVVWSYDIEDRYLAQKKTFWQHLKVIWNIMIES